MALFLLTNQNPINSLTMNSKGLLIMLKSQNHRLNTRILLPTNGTKSKRWLNSIWELTVSLKQAFKKDNCLSFFPTNVTVCRLFCGMRTLTRLPVPMVWLVEKHLLGAHEKENNLWKLTKWLCNPNSTINPKWPLTSFKSTLKCAVVELHAPNQKRKNVVKLKLNTLKNTIKRRDNIMIRNKLFKNINDRYFSQYIQ